MAHSSFLLREQILCTAKNPKSLNKAQTVLQMVDFLCARDNLPRKEGKKYLSSIFWKPDPELLSYFFDALQQELFHIKQLYDADPQAIDETIASVRINNILCYIAYTQPDTLAKTTLQVPVMKDGKCILGKYNINALELTPKWMRFLASPYYAYALEPDKEKNTEQLPSQLLFMGTTYPAARGSLWTYIVDLIPGLSVGNLLFLIEKNKIGKWIADQKKSPKILCHGQSLGGSLSIFTAEAFRKEVDAIAHVPAGRLFYRKSKFEGSNVTIIMHDKDPVTKLHAFPTKARMLLVQSNQDPKEGPTYDRKPGVLSMIFSHAASLISHPKATIKDISKEYHENPPVHRKWIAFLLITGIISIPLLAVLLILNTVFRTLSSPFYGFYRDTKKIKKEIPCVFLQNPASPEDPNLPKQELKTKPPLTNQPSETIIEIPTIPSTNDPSTTFKI